MEPFDELLMQTIKRAARDRAGRTATTVSIFARLPVVIPERTLRYRLRRLEQRGLLKRPVGLHSGYAPTLWGNALLERPTAMLLPARRIA